MERLWHKCADELQTGLKNAMSHPVQDGSLCVQECFRFCYRVRDSFLREAPREAPPPKSIMARVTVRINMIRSIEWVKKTIQVLIKKIGRKYLLWNRRIKIRFPKADI